MKCPWRTTNVKYRDGAVIFDRTDFEECYRDECPFWQIIGLRDDGIALYGCMRERKVFKVDTRNT